MRLHPSGGIQLLPGALRVLYVDRKLCALLHSVPLSVVCVEIIGIADSLHLRENATTLSDLFGNLPDFEIYMYDNNVDIYRGNSVIRTDKIRILTHSRFLYSKNMGGRIISL